MMRMAVLGSGSKGNATVVQCGATTILIDAGLSAKQLKLRMESIGVTVEQLDAVLLTHEHQDHTRGVRVLLKGAETPVYANMLTKECLEHKMEGVKWKVFQNGADFSIGEFEVKAFPVPHDAQEPVGFVMDNPSGKIGVLTDIGYITGVVRNALQGLTALFVEANYDMALLEDDLKRPWAIKQRISSRHGHLSNEQTAELYADIACGSLQHMVLGHLSSDCNTGDLAKEALREICQQKAIELPTEIVVASQDEPTKWVEFGKQKLPMVNEGAGQGELF